MIRFSCRLSLLQPELTCELTGGALACSDGRVLDFADIACIRLYAIRGASLGGARRCVVRPVRGRAIVLSSMSFLGLGRFEDRAESFQPFVDALIEQVAAANPQTQFIAGMPLALWGLWAVALAGFAFTLPLTMALVLIPLLGDSGVASLAVAVSVVAGTGFLLFYFYRALKPDWPKEFDPRTP